TGHDDQKDPNISQHYFPADPDLRQAWKLAIRREHFEPSKNSVICSLHFLPSDFKVESSDSNPRRKRNRKDNSLVSRRLVKEAVPTVFPNLPSYYTKSKPKPRGDNSSQNRNDKTFQRHEKEAAAFLDGEKFSSVDEVMGRIDLSCFPDVIVTKKNNALLIYQLAFSDNDHPPQMIFTIEIFHDLTFQVWIGQVISSRGSLLHIIRDDKLSSTGQLINLIAHARNKPDNQRTEVDTYEQCYQLLEGTLVQEGCSEETKKKVAFLMEQLKLLKKKENARRYSPTLLAVACLWENTSPSLYRMILHDGFLTLPSSSHLNRLSRAFSVESGVSEGTKAYLKARAGKLNEREKIVALLVDEVATAKRVEYSNGTFFGFEKMEPTKTVLAFLITSICGKYKDVVGLNPVVKLNAELLAHLHRVALRAATEAGFLVITSICDGHSVNRRFYSEMLCDGRLKVSISNEEAGGQSMFLLFDVVHLFKNFFTNLLRRKHFDCPDFQGIRMNASFAHVKSLYELELGKPIKVAHKLTAKVLNPRPIECMSVELADRFFHPSTIAGLQYYSKDHPEWMGTAHFLQTIRNWFNVLNVKTTFTGMRKRDWSKDPIRTSDSVQLKFLENFAEWLEKWEKQKTLGLSKETFLCAIQTSKAMPKLIVHLLEKEGMDYVLTGKICSDPIEKRFGDYRMLGGSNYYVSVRQILEAEKKIRLNSLIRLSSFTLKEAKNVLSASSEGEVENDTSALLAAMEVFEGSCIPSDEGDEGAVFYVAGYVAQKLVKSTKCQACQEIVSKGKTVPRITFDVGVDQESKDLSIKSTKDDLISLVTRGGLTYPSDATFYGQIMENQELRQLFMRFKNPQKSFVAALMEILLVQEDKYLLAMKCTNEHSFSSLLPDIFSRFFNCMSKNHVSEINDTIHNSKKRGGDHQDKIQKKIMKLQSSMKK
ncbi:Putative LOC101234561, partial [Caligus rogercresseyi]